MKLFKNTILSFIVILLITVNANAQQILESKAGIASDNFGWAMGMSGDGNWLALSKHPGANFPALFEIYKRSGNTFVIFQVVTTQQNISFDGFEFSTDGNRLAVIKGAGFQRQGEALVYELQGSEFVKIGNSIREENRLESFGNSGAAFSFSDDGSTLAIGTRDYDLTEDNGLIEIYEYNGTDWVDKGSRVYGEDNQRIGRDVALSADGNKLVVSNSPASASVIRMTNIYEFENGDWQLIGEVEDCGGPVRITGDGNRVITICDGESHFLELIDNEWQETLPRINHAEVIPFSTGPLETDMTPDGHHFLFSNGDGTVYMFELIQGNWVQNAGVYLNTQQKLLFGSGLQLDDDASRMVIGQAQYNDLGGRVFHMIPGEQRGVQIRPFLDKNLNGIKDDVEPYIIEVTLTVDEAYTLLPTPFGYLLTGSDGLHRVSLSIGSEFDLGEEFIEIQLGAFGSYDLPLQISEIGPEFEFRAYSSNYICNSFAKFLFDIPTWLGNARRLVIELHDKDLAEGGNVIESWDEELLSCESLILSTLVQLPDETATGDILNFAFVVKEYDLATGDFLETYIKDLAGILLCAVDPNDKLVTPIGREPNDLTHKDETLNYRIRFQNTGNLPATNIYLLDKIDENLDIKSFKVIDASHELTAVEMDDDRLVKFYFDNINLPDSINNEPESHGYVEFMIKPYPDLPELTEINNQAEIYFDLNEPIVTNETRSVLTTFPRTTLTDENIEWTDFMISPNPTNDRLLWSQDLNILSYKVFDSVGRIYMEESGLDNYSISVSHLPTQLYWITLETKEGYYKSSFVKQ